MSIDVLTQRHNTDNFKGFESSTTDKTRRKNFEMDQDGYQYKPKSRRPNLSSDYQYEPSYERENSMISERSSNMLQPRSKPRSNRPPQEFQPDYDDQRSGMESLRSGNHYINNREPERSFSPFNTNDIDANSLGYTYDQRRRSKDPENPGSFHSALLPPDGNYSRSNSNLDGHFWTPDTNAIATIPRGSQAKIVSKKENPLSKLFSSMRRGKSQQNLTEDNMDGNATIERQPKSRFRSLSRSEASQLSPARVIMLDGTETTVQLDKPQATGRYLFERVCEEAQICEVDFFGLTYHSKKYNTWFWLEIDSKISKQLTCEFKLAFYSNFLDGEDWTFFFQVKFYAPEPCLLQEDITRYHLVLQLRQDIYTGKLPCSWVTQALLGSFTLQSEVGDSDLEHPLDLAQLRNFQFVRNPTNELLTKIQELHKSHVGLTPAQADLRYLETAKRLELYGIDLHPARDMENVQIHIGVGYQGVVIYRDNRRIGRFAWPKVLKISYEKNNFYLTIRPDNTDPVEAKIGFRLHSNLLAKRLWMSAVDHHAFFRLKEWKKANVLNSSRGTLKKSTFGGSQHQLSSRTFFQNRNMTINRPNPHFDRAITKQLTASMPMGLNQSQYGNLHSSSNPSQRPSVDMHDEASFEPIRDAYGGSAHDLVNPSRNYGGSQLEDPRSEPNYGKTRKNPNDYQKYDCRYDFENSYQESIPDSQGYIMDHRPPQRSQGGFPKPRSRPDEVDSFNGSVLSAEGRRVKPNIRAAQRYEIDENGNDHHDIHPPISQRLGTTNHHRGYDIEDDSVISDPRVNRHHVDYQNPVVSKKPTAGNRQPPAGAWSYGVQLQGPPGNQLLRKNRRPSQEEEDLL